MPPTSEDTQKIHAQYRALTGLDVPYTMTAYFMWSAYLARGLGEPDLACMVRYIKGKIKRGPRTKESLLMENMIKDLDTFQSYLSIARAEARNEPTQTPRQRALESIGRISITDTPVKSTDQILREAVALKAFQEWKASNL